MRIISARHDGRLMKLTWPGSTNSTRSSDHMCNVLASSQLPGNESTKSSG